MHWKESCSILITWIVASNNQGLAEDVIIFWEVVPNYNFHLNFARSGLLSYQRRWLYFDAYQQKHFQQQFRLLCVFVCLNIIQTLFCICLHQELSSCSRVKTYLTVLQKCASVAFELMSKSKELYRFHWYNIDFNLNNTFISFPVNSHDPHDNSWLTSVYFYWPNIALSVKESLRLIFAT